MVDTSSSRAAERSEVTYKYGSHARQRLDAYWNASSSLQPGIVILHGGYWYEDASWATKSRAFADAGYATFSVDYRLNFDAQWPAQRSDALAALSWVRDNAAKFNLDPDRVVVLGSSAGGQIATAVATYGSGGNTVKGVVGLSPVASPYRAWNDGNHETSTFQERKVRDNATVLARCYPDPADTDTSMHASCWDTWKDMVVKNRASGANDAPMYLIHSQDDFVPVTHSTDLEKAEEVDQGMPTNGVTVETVPGAAHGGSLLDEPGMMNKVLAWIDARVDAA
ncbi:alpha/beta hydrolase [Streptomyces sp. ISL-100]|nr:alpha/beta hydrolase [Streptomyces sp. ISL-100]